MDSLNTIPQTIINHYLSHQFDLLGSGWSRVFYGRTCRGLLDSQYVMGSEINIDNKGNWLRNRINKSNLNYSQKIWNMLDSSYVPIDWHLDFISGYRWSEKVWYKSIEYGHKEGVDIKVPWELSRMQHLPQLGLKALTLNDSLDKKNLLIDEFRNQVSQNFFYF